MRRALILFAALALASPVYAQGVSIRVLGAGTQSCGDWTSTQGSSEFVNQMTHLAMIQWMNGYLTAMQQAMPHIVAQIRSTDMSGMTGWIDQWCAAHPLDNVAGATQALVGELSARAVGSRP